MAALTHHNGGGLSTGLGATHVPLWHLFGQSLYKDGRPSPDLTFESGHCASWNWFEKEAEQFCPLAMRCGAYGRKWPGGTTAVPGISQ